MTWSNHLSILVILIHLSSFVAQRLRALEENIRNLTTTMQFFVEEFNSIRSSGTVSKLSSF